MTKILAIEDNDAKWERIEPVLSRAFSNATIVRAKDLYDGEREVEKAGWDLLLLDVSLDIRAGAGRAGRGSHDYVGGLKIAGRMFYLECEVPTIIVTGFDAFPTGASSSSNAIILGLEDVEREASRLLGDYLLGAIRFGTGDWEAQLESLLGKGRRE